tara:strand:+ start:734 stop:952 length:219 start_codon:yes stop_codon:yes gene_type:complete
MGICIDWLKQLPYEDQVDFLEDLQRMATISEVGPFVPIEIDDIKYMIPIRVMELIDGLYSMSMRDGHGKPKD